LLNTFQVSQNHFRIRSLMMNQKGKKHVAATLIIVENDFQHFVLHEYCREHCRRIVSSLDKKKLSDHQKQRARTCPTWESCLNRLVEVADPPDERVVPKVLERSDVKRLKALLLAVRRHHSLGGPLTPRPSWPRT